MRILVVTVQVPFVRGGAEVHAEELRNALIAAGHSAEIVAIPFKWYPPERILDHMLACKLIDLSSVCGQNIDRVIALKFPAYYVNHPNKVLWVLHQHRTAYELWDAPISDMVDFENGREVRDAIERADRAMLPKARLVFANSLNVAKRMKQYCDVDAKPLYHPPRDAGLFHSKPAEDFVFMPSRLVEIKRQYLVIDALAETKSPLTVAFCGTADHARYAEELKERAVKRNISDRIKWLGEISEPAKRDLYARCIAVVYPPVDEDLGYVTMEAMLSSKPVITCSDSGGTLEFVKDGESGLVTEPTAAGIAAALDQIWNNRKRAAAMGRRGHEIYREMRISWDNVVEQLLQ